MCGSVGVGVHLIAVEEEMLGLAEGDLVSAHELEALCAADGGEQRVDLCEVDGVRGFAEKSEEDGAVGAVADAGEGEGTIEVDGEGAGCVEELRVELADEAQSSAHGADGVRA